MNEQDLQFHEQIRKLLPGVDWVAWTYGVWREANAQIPNTKFTVQIHEHIEKHEAWCSIGIGGGIINTEIFRHGIKGGRTTEQCVDAARGFLRELCYQIAQAMTNDTGKVKIEQVVADTE